MQIDRGFLSPYFVTSPDTQEAVLENPWDKVKNKIGKVVKMKIQNVFFPLDFGILVSILANSWFSVVDLIIILYFKSKSNITYII